MSSNPWIMHVKAVASKRGLSYKDAMKVAGKTYKKGQSGNGFFEDFGKGFVKGITGGIVDLDPKKGTAINKFMPFGKSGYLTKLGVKPSDVASAVPAFKAGAVPLKAAGQGKKKRKAKK